MLMIAAHLTAPTSSDLMMVNYIERAASSKDSTSQVELEKDAPAKIGRPKAADSSTVDELRTETMATSMESQIEEAAASSVVNAGLDVVVEHDGFGSLRACFRAESIHCCAIEDQNRSQKYCISKGTENRDTFARLDCTQV
jgi:hypothetical protein